MFKAFTPRNVHEPGDQSYGVFGYAVGLALFCCLSLIACSRDESSLAKSASSVPKSAEGVSVDIRSVDFSRQWIVNASEASALIEQGATVLDARGGWLRRPVTGANPVKWQDFSLTDATVRGRLLEDDQQLESQLRSLGISNNKPVVVIGSLPNGWGEDGRIVWMLRSLGHTQAVMVDGGLRALQNANVSIPEREQTEGDFVVRRDERWSIEKEELRSLLYSDSGSDNTIWVDTREPREYGGSTPYGEQRGGHIPDAVSLYFKDLIDEDGKILPEAVLRERLANIGITPDKQIVAYCTGGIRSGWLVAVLTSMDYQVKNYAGSMWEWSASSADDYPLEID